MSKIVKLELEREANTVVFVCSGCTEECILVSYQPPGHAYPQYCNFHKGYDTEWKIVKPRTNYLIETQE